MDVLPHLPQFQAQHAVEHILAAAAAAVPTQSKALVHDKMGAFLFAPPDDPPQHAGRVAARERVLRVRQHDGADGAAQAALGGGGVGQAGHQLGRGPAGADVLAEAGADDVVAGDGAHVQAVAGGDGEGEQGARCGDQNGVARVGEVEEEGVQEGGQAVAGEDVGRGEGDARAQGVVQELGGGGGQLGGLLRVVVLEVWR